jgi:TRAP-type uncharacterized transport system substrate-binding protein
MCAILEYISEKVQKSERKMDGTDGEPRNPGFMRRWLDLAQVLAPALILIGLVVFAALHLIRPAPPNTLTMASGPEGSKFHTVAVRYQQILAKNGITLKLVTTQGSLENLDRLFAQPPAVDIALVQSGTPFDGDTRDIVSLGSMFYVPLTIFYRSPAPLLRLSQLAGKRIAIGAPGSGTRSLALALLKANEIDVKGSTSLLDLEGEAAREALLHQQVDAIFLTGDSAAPETIREMLHAPGIRLFDFPQADAYARRFRYLSKLELPAGAFDLGENLPPNPIYMLAPTVVLLAHADLHPALSDLLIEAAIEVHGGASLLQNAGQFPSPVAITFPLSDDAARYYKSGKSFAYRYFPFWLATLLDRTVVVILPVILVLIPVLRFLPSLYNWRITRRVSRRYQQLMAIERQSLRNLSAEERAQLIESVARIEKAVIALKMPGSHAEQLYILRQHMQFVRENLARTATP